MNRTKRIVFTSLWSGHLNGRNVSGVSKFSLDLVQGLDYNSLGIGYLKVCASSLGISDFLVREICYDV